jgi:[ribosomal protein S5]-alanine N-acetyltransferase
MNSFIFQKSILTKKFSLFPFYESDLKVFFDLVQISSFQKCFWDFEVDTYEKAKEILLLNENSFRDHQYGLWKIYENSNGQIIGMVGFWQYPTEETPQLIYGIIPEYSKQGIVTESCKLIINYAFKFLNFNNITASCSIKNEPSIKICNSLNMKLLEQKYLEEEFFLFFNLNKDLYNYQYTNSY